MENLEYENPVTLGLMSALGPGLISGAFPGIGPVVAEYLNGATLARRHNRIVEYIANLDSDFQKYKEYVDNEYIRSEEFEDLFADLLIEASKISREELRGLYRNIALAAAIDGNNSQLKA